MQKTLIVIGVFISFFFSKNLTAAEPLECLKDEKAPEVIQNEKGYLSGSNYSFSDFMNGKINEINNNN